MKFGLHLKENIVEEWAVKYIRYDVLKEKIELIQKAIQLAEENGYGQVDLGRAPDIRSWNLPVDTDNIGDQADVSLPAEAPVSPTDSLAQELLSHPGGQADPQPNAHLDSSRELVFYVRDMKHHARVMSSETSGLLRRPADRNVVQAESVFMSTLRDDLLEVDSFFREKEQLYRDRLRDIVGILKAMAQMSSVDHNDVEEVKRALLELYRGYLLLYNFCTLNYTAAYKICKKFDKVTHWGISGPVLERVALMAFQVREPRVEQAAEDIILLYADAFHHGDVHKSRSELTERKQRPVETFWNVYSLGFFMGMCLPLLWHMALVATVEAHGWNQTAFYASLPVFRGSILLVLTLWCWAFVQIIFEKQRINYVFIMELDPLSALSYNQLLKMCALLTALWLTFFTFFLGAVRSEFNVGHVAVQYYPMMLVLVLVCITFFPFNFFFRASRIWLFKRLVHVVLSPFGEIRFSDFLIGDILTSLVKVLYDIEYTACFYTSGSWRYNAAGECIKENRSVGLPVLTSLPMFWRMMQSLRRYNDERRSEHLFNALKYAVGFAAVLVGALFQRSYSLVGNWDAWKLTYIGMLGVAQLYMYFWDLVMDWGLFYWKNGRIYVRDAFHFHKFWIYLAMLTNFVGRFVWTLTIVTIPITTSLNPQLLTFLLAFIEILRRTQWILIRIENEHVSNCGHFRAVRHVPLPFHHGTTPPLIGAFKSLTITNILAKSRKPIKIFAQGGAEDLLPDGTTSRSTSRRASIDSGAPSSDAYAAQLAASLAVAQRAERAATLDLPAAGAMPAAASTAAAQARHRSTSRSRSRLSSIEQGSEDYSDDSQHHESLQARGHKVKKPRGFDQATQFDAFGKPIAQPTRRSRAPLERSRSPQDDAPPQAASSGTGLTLSSLYTSPRIAATASSVYDLASAAPSLSAIAERRPLSEPAATSPKTDPFLQAVAASSERQSSIQ